MSECILIQKDLPKDDLHEDNLKKYLPHFLWLLRDSSLKLPYEGERQLTATEYLKTRVLIVKDGNPEVVASRVKRAIMTLFPSLECYALPHPYDADSPENDIKFVKEITSLFNYILQKITPKQGYKDGVHPNGSILAALAQQYADNLNENKPPNLEWSWQSATEQYLAEFAQKLEDEYEHDMSEAISSRLPMEEGTIETLSDVEIIESIEPTLLSIHQSCFEQKLKQLKDKVDQLMPFVPTRDSTANAVQDKKNKIYNAYEARIIVVKEHSVVGGRLLSFMKENQHSSKILCMSKFDKIQSTLRHQDKFSIQTLKLEYDNEAVGPAKKEVFEQKRKLIPDPPADIKCVPKHDSLALTWNKPHANTGTIKLYKVQLLQDSRPKRDIYSDGPKVSIEVTGLTPNTPYRVRICSCNEQYKSEYSQYIDIQTTAGVPAKPNKPEICSESEGQVKVSVHRLAKEHQNGSPVNKIIVQCELNSKWETNNVEVNDDVKPIVMYVSLPSTSNDSEIKNFYYRVAMENSAGRSEFSEVATLPVTEIYPYKTDLVIQDEDIFPRHVRLRFSPPKLYPNSVKYFSIRMKEGESSQWKSLTHKCEQSEYIVENLKPVATYTFQIACCNAKHDGEWSEECKVTTKADRPNPPKKPEIVTEKEKCILTIPRISKGDDNGNSIKKIIIESDENDSGSWSRQEISSDNINEKPFRTSLSPVFYSSSRDAILYYRVRFVNDTGTSDPSDVAQLHVTDLFPNQPEEIHVLEATSNQIRLEWSLPKVNPTSITHCAIKYKKSNEKFKPEEKLDKPYYCASGLLPDTQYVFAISCRNEKYSGEWCNFPMKTMPGPPDPPEKPKLYEVKDQNNKTKYYLTFKKLLSENENGSPVSKISVESSNDADSTEWVAQHHPVEEHDKIIKVPIEPYIQSNDVNFFHYRACFENKVGRSEYSDVLHISVMDLCPPPPENFRVAQTSARRIRLVWDRPTYNPYSVMHYKVMMAENYCSANQTEWTKAAIVTDQFHIYDNLLPARSYKFRAASCNSNHPGGGEWCKEEIVRTIADKPSRPSKPDIRIELDDNGKIRCLLSVTMLSEDKENGSPVEKIIVESKRHNVSKYDAKECIADRHNPVQPLLIMPPNATETFTLQYRIRMKNQAGSSDPSDVRELESAQMIPGPPKDLVADRDKILFNRIVLSWKEPDENPKSVEYYIIQKRLESQVNETDTSFNHEWSDIKKCDDTDVTKASITDLTPNTKYQFQIISFNKDGRKCRQSSNILDICTKPCKPQQPESSSITLIVKNQFSATLSLPKPPIAETGSEIQEMSIQRLGQHKTPEESTPDLNNPFIYKVPKNEDEMIVMDIPIGSATHFIRVKLKNSMGYSAYSLPVGVAPKDLKPGAPIIINKEKMNPSTENVVIEWEAPTVHKRAANMYMFLLKKSCDLDWGQPIKPDNLEVNGDSYRATLRNLSPCTQYRVCIYAANGALRGDYSEEISILTKAGKPHAPPVPTIYVKDDPTKANVSFEHKIERDNGASIELIRVECYINRNEWKLVYEENVKDSKSDFFDVNIPLESVTQPFDTKCEYRYRVKLKNKVGESSPSEAVSLPFSVLKPGEVQDVNYEAKAHHVTLHWKPPKIHPALVNGYTIEEQICVNECTWKPIQTCEPGTNSSTIKFLASNKDYVYRITAVSKYDIKGIPLIVNTKTEEIFPTKPLNLRVDRKCSNMFKVRWKEPHCDPDALYYYKLEVFEGISAKSELVYACTLKKNCTSKVVSNLKASTSYLIKVIAMNEAKHWKQGEEQKSYDEIIEKTPMSKTKRNVASTFMGIPTLGIAAAAFLYFMKPDAEDTIIESDDESSYLDEWSLQDSAATCQQVNGSNIKMDIGEDRGQSSNDDDFGPDEEAQNLLQQ